MLIHGIGRLRTATSSSIRRFVGSMKQIIGVFTVAALLPLLGAQNNPAAGTWKLNVEESKFSPGPPPKSATLVIEAQGESVKTSYEEIEGDDSHVGFGYTATLDGKDYPLNGSSRPDLLRGAETVAVRRNGSHAFGAMFKKSGQVMMTDMISVSKDAKTLKRVVNGADAKGQPATLVTVWNKQSP
jgi:hypothetical protein